jgi:DNA-binding transcriptional ArsR family regulator
MPFASFDSILTHMFVGTRGGDNRLRIIKKLERRQFNPNQLVKELGLDYKTIVHHLEILEENGLVERAGNKTYGGIFSMTEFGKSNMGLINRLIRDLGEGK